MPISLAKRYAFKLLANCATIPVYLVMEAILPRALGPRAYGEFSFATNLFQQCMGFLDMGSSTCFYAALSRRQRELGLIGFYGRVSLVVLALCMLLSLALLHPALGERIMPHVPLWMAPLAALWAFLTWFGRVVRSVNDAFGATVPSELARAAIGLGGMLVLATMFWADALDIISLFIQQYLVLSALILGFWHVVRQNHKHIPWTLAAADAHAYRAEFFRYSHPLFVQALLSFVFLTGERWLLQWFDGSAEQGFFALSQKVSLACFLFVSAMTPLIMRELSIAWGQRDTALMGRLITRFAPLLYVVAAYFSCFTFMEASFLVQLFGGAQFAQALLPVQIMALYPVHQAYGQLAGSVFQAIGRTTVLRDLTVVDCLGGIVVSWLLIAPPEYFGLRLGAAGLAVKITAVQFVMVNIYFRLVARMLAFNYLRNLLHQLASLAVLLGLAFVSREVTFMLPPALATGFARFLLSGALYSLLAALCLLAAPRLAGCTRQELYSIAGRVWRNAPWKRHSHAN
ncbi:MAG: oligosaccharide flippase family protein [Deltaproteobacteria bacterium]|jgi:O-antigen/teichoic acid export membrane protein|nr:oligosaccharide flippase family protein [Deltaproteobacteria bacterium]